MTVTGTNNPSLPANYVTILDLREQWLNKQQCQYDHEEEQQESPKNYVTINDLRDRWLKQQEKEKEEEKMKVSLDDDDDGEDGKLEKNKTQYQNPNNLNKKPQFRNHNKLRPRKVNAIGETDKNKPQFRNPSKLWKPVNANNLVGEDDGKLEKNISQFHNPNKLKQTYRGKGVEGVIEKEFCRNPNSYNQRWFRVEKKVLTESRGIQVDDLTMDAPENKGEDEIEAEFGGRDRLNDIGIVGVEKETIRNYTMKKSRKGMRRNRVINGELQKPVSEKQNVGVEVGESTQEASENDAVVEIEAEIDGRSQLKDAKMVRDEQKKPKKKKKMENKRNEKNRNLAGKVEPENDDCVGDSTVECVAEIKQTTGFRKRNVTTEKQNVSKTVGFKDTKGRRFQKGVAEIEAKMTEVRINENHLLATETEIKEVTVVEKESPVTENQKDLKCGHEVWNVKTVGEVGWGDRRAMANRNQEYSSRGRCGKDVGWKKVYNSRDKDKGLMWVKKGEAN